MHALLYDTFNEFSKIYGNGTTIACNHKHIIWVKDCCKEKPFNESDYCRECGDLFELIPQCEDCGADLEDIPEEIC
jgi:hypothetical protein